MSGFSLVPSGYGNNYTGILTRSIVFSGALIGFLATFAMSLAANIIPNWISYSTTTDAGTHIHQTYGLHSRCSNTLPLSPITQSNPTTCTTFPTNSDCVGNERYFCSMWRSVGFLMSFAVVIEGMTIAAFLVLLLGGKQKREAGWGVLCVMVCVAAVVQAGSMSIIAYLFDYDSRFILGWRLDDSWILCTVSWSIQLLCAAAIAIGAVVLPSEGGYELIPDHVFDRA